MEKSGRSQQRKGARSSTGAVDRISWWVCLLLCGCASQGPLRPPSLHLPAAVRGLKADRIGDTVLLNWTDPTRTTDGLPLDGKHVPRPLAVEICRNVKGHDSCLPARGISVAPGTAGTFRDTLPPELASGPPELLTYRVRLINGDGKGAAFATVQAAAGLAPPPLSSVVAMRVHSGVLLRWQTGALGQDEKVQVRVHRGEGPTAQAPQDILLNVEPSNRSGAGAIDGGAKPGVAQAYSLARVRTVHLAGTDLVLQGDAVTTRVSAEARPPAPLPPAGLAAVSSTLAAPEIDLVWQPADGAESYRVYRAEAGGATQLLTPEPVRGLTFADKAVRLGSRYRYSVSAVSSDGQEGVRGQEVTEQVSAR